MAVADTIRVELVWRMLQVDWAVNVLHYTTGSSDPLTQANVTALGLVFDGIWTSSGLESATTGDIEFGRVVCRDLRTDGNPPLQHVLNDSGSSAEPALPSQTCLVTTVRTANGTRRGRGRIFWSLGNRTLSTTGGVASSTYVNAIQAWMDDIALVAAGTLGNLALGVYSRADDVTRTATSWTTNNTFDVQTRRRDLSIV